MGQVSEPAPHRRGALVVLVLVVAAGCLALGWWQWERFESSSGSGQNLGYALQWPLFAAFAVYAYRRFVQLEDDPYAQRSDPAVVTELPADVLPPRPAPAAAAPDAGLQDYNAYLAELAARDTRSTP